ncbi:roundabout homolog 2-like [Ptychodera flava]|uniref:roundabout homolog 2-like n=1 Tax=Ptychodera flava TaxID=63121 RepID=UPI00396A3D9E
MSVFESFLVLALLCRVACARYREFERVPEDTTVIEGSSVVLRCQVLKEYRTLQFTVYWEINGSIINPRTSKTKRYTLIEDRVEGIYDLEIRPVTEDDEGVYVCVIDFIDPFVSRSLPAELNVIRVPIPSFLQEPESTLVAEGETGTLGCHIGNFTEEHLYVAWFKDHYEVLSMIGFKNVALSLNMNSSRYSILKKGNGEFTLKITNVSRSDAGNYSCLVFVKNGDRILESRQAILSVTYHECYIGGVQRETEVYQEGDNITTVCIAGLSGYKTARNDLIYVAWVRDGDEFPGSREFRQNSEIKSTMSWSLTAADDKNPFVCQIKYSNQLNQVICRIDPINVHFARE